MTKRAGLLGLILAAMAGSAMAADDPLRVGPKATFRTITEALAAAAPGQRVEIESGTYREALDIARPVTLVAVDTGGGQPLIDGRKAVAPVTIRAEGVTIDGMAITAQPPKRPLSYLTPFMEEACVVITAARATIRNSDLSGCAKGIHLRNAASAVIADNIITGNAVGGIFLLNSRDTTITGNTVIDNGPYEGIAVHSFAFAASDLAPLRATGLVGDWWSVTPETRAVADIISQDITIARNTVSGHGGSGIAVGYARRVTVTGNESHDNGGGEMAKADAAYFGLKPPLRERGAGIALYCDAHDSTVDGNRVYANDSIGIFVAGAPRNRLTDNVVEDNRFGILVSGAYSTTVRGNAVSGAKDFGLRIETGAFAVASVDAVVIGNDLANPGPNAFDDTGTATTLPEGWLAVVAERLLPPFPLAALARPNAWDDGARGNRHGDFDEAKEGFEDSDGDGIGAPAHPIPGGAAIDRFPLSGAAQAEQPKGKKAKAADKAPPGPSCRGGHCPPADATAPNLPCPG